MENFLLLFTGLDSSDDQSESVQLPTFPRALVLPSFFFFLFLISIFLRNVCRNSTLLTYPSRGGKEKNSQVNDLAL
jgi:hypothetical protein